MELTDIGLAVRLVSGSRLRRGAEVIGNLVHFYVGGLELRDRFKSIEWCCDGAASNESKKAPNTPKGQPPMGRLFRVLRTSCSCRGDWSTPSQPGC